MKYRIKPQYSLDPASGFPTTDYAIQSRVWGVWQTLDRGEAVFTEKQPALDRLAALEAADLEEREDRLHKRRALMRRLSGAQKP